MNLIIFECIQNYLNSVKLSRSANTYRTYANAMRLFSEVLAKNGLDPESADLSELTEDAVIWMATALKDFSSATEQVYMTACGRLIRVYRRGKPGTDQSAQRSGS